jgi:hypothetical protein
VGVHVLRVFEFGGPWEPVWGVWGGKLNIGWMDGRWTNRFGWRVVYDYDYLCFGGTFCALMTWFRFYQKDLRHDFWFLGTGA